VVPHSDLLKVAREAAGRAAGFIRAARRPDPAEWHRKARSDFVTDVDRDAERLITDALVAAEPGSRVVGEEAAAGPPTSCTTIRHTR
jgi:fructose-1,6-bisphosphatase/inositol monophosphatase family enzyme